MSECYQHEKQRRLGSPCPYCINTSLREEITALKAEVERLKAILDRAISHIDETARGPYYIAIPRLYGELGKIFRGEEP